MSIAVTSIGLPFIVIIPPGLSLKRNHLLQNVSDPSNKRTAYPKKDPSELPVALHIDE